jgi:serine protease DegQ
MKIFGWKSLAFVLASAWAAPVAAQEKPPVSVPFDTIASRHMIVDVMVNGKGPYTLIFDTGAPITLIGSKLAREAKVTSGGFAALFSLFSQQKIDKLELGGIKLDKVDAIVLDHPIVMAIGQMTGKKIDGIVGFNVFGQYKTTIDYQAKTLSFIPTDFQPVNMLEALTKMMTSGELERPTMLAPKGLLGVSVVKKAGDEAAGVTIETVHPGSPAAKAGVEPGDRLLTLDRRWTDQIRDCFEAARTLRPGETVLLEIERGGKKQTLKAVVGAGF